MEEEYEEIVENLQRDVMRMSERLRPQARSGERFRRRGTRGPNPGPARLRFLVAARRS